jgi:filamentous hemagglutinin family protein
MPDPSLLPPYMKHHDSRRACARGRSLLAASPVRAAVLLTLLPAFAWWNVPLQANPGGGVVVHGNVAMEGQAGRVLNIRQGSANAIIDWESFSIDADEMTRFIQPGTNSAVLNRVTGGDLSEIHGALRANGNVFLINPNGILVGPGGSIDVHGLVLSTLDLENGEFLAGGDQVFKGSSSAGVTNLGRINAIGGDVFLIGRTVTNSGSVHAREGTVGLAAGEEVLIKADDGFGGERVFIRATGAGVSGTGILNDGTIAGAAAELKAHGNHYALAINNQGAIRATGAVHSGGRVHLQGIGGGVSNSGSIRATSSGVGRGASILIAAAYAKVDGELRAESHSAVGSVKIEATDAVEIGAKIESVSSQGSGGFVGIEAERILLKAGSIVDVSGSRGGEVLIGGGFQGGDPGFTNAKQVKMEKGATVRADAIGSGMAGASSSGRMETPFSKAKSPHSAAGRERAVLSRSRAKRV